MTVAFVNKKDSLMVKKLTNPDLISRLDKDPDWVRQDNKTTKKAVKKNK